MRRSLLLRLFVLSALVAVASIAATAWLAARTTSGAIQQEQGQALADDGNIYRGLLKYAATHPSWHDVGDQLRGTAATTGRRIALTLTDGTPIADSATDGRPLPLRPSIVVDPLSVDSGLGQDTTADRIDPDAVGPYALPEADRANLAAVAQRVLRCVQGRSGLGSVETSPGGHPRIEGADPFVLSSCNGTALSRPTKTEQTALDQLSTLVNACLNRGPESKPLAQVQVLLDFTWVHKGVAAEESEQAVRSCLNAARREQLTPFVAPAASLYLTAPSGEPPAGFTLSPENQVRLFQVAGGILLLTLLVTAFAGLRLIRPLRALTGAAQRMEAGESGAQVKVRGRDEIARLGTAFNAMSASRERLEETRKAMVSDIAHELRTPLSNIRGWLEATQDGISRLDDELVDSLLEEAVHLQHIVDDLQDLALADAGALRLHPEPVDVAALLAQVVAAFRPAEVSLTAAAGPLSLTADPVRLRQAVGNLVSNAVRHTPAGGSVEVRGRRDGDDVVIEVADTGAGIAAEDLPHVFDRFWRADKARTRTTGGSGLGLAIVRKLAEAHGGTATAESVPGQGSTFTLRLPAGTAAG
ncbi:two-component sensor histidine kinase [Amycolatopsis sp. NBRC 101858]|uniref:sensor histidine kinase n=1 Tax=Amycolatopsis sp. NBRC 101858 TaxID=3032200 RepID=UPI0024A5A220|nr:HAMP domain-containing sensor histidine kinase [Amycolatopsis sp. NBRC 101858]GLY34617.1 two-component sensor histidine kinase [Amycolatopsis sp. NBRC 101858]